jgi:uncharacterized repeat protein (TIGR01451 family)
MSPPPGTYTVQACHEPTARRREATARPSRSRDSAGHADLTLTKTATTSPVAPGGQLTYQIGISNNGPGLATQVVVTDNLPPQLTFRVDKHAGGLELHHACSRLGRQRQLRTRAR